MTQKFNNKPLLIIGGHSLALEIRETAESVYPGPIYNVVADDDTCNYNFITDSQLEPFVKGSKEVNYILGFTIATLRDKYKNLLSSLGATPYSILSNRAYISPTAIIEEGCYVGQMAVISSNVHIAKHVVVNFLVGIGHDAIIEEDCIINPGVTISGHCRIGAGTLVGSNSFVFQGLNISSHSIIDAMTCVKKGCKEPTLYSDKNKKQVRVANPYI